MESLTRNNYEVWFLDYLDGQLSDEQLETLLDFLELNPDLKAELQGVSGVSLSPGQETIGNKEMLVKTAEDIPGISSIDQLCIARMENDLSPAEARNFDSRLSSDAALKENYAALKLTRLDPAEQIVYPYKKELLQKTRVLAPWIITAVSAAAVLVIALLIWPDGEKSAVSSGQLAENSKQSTVSSGQLAEVAKPANEGVIPANETIIGRGVIPAKAGTPSLAAQPKGNLPTKPYSVIPAKAGTSSLTAKASGGTSSLTTKPSSSTPSREFVPMNSLARKASVAGPKIPDPHNLRLLYASNYQPVLKNIPAIENTLTLPQYALQLFRERILGQDPKQVKKTRFSMWEVAGAGVDKINLLAGTKMKLDREYDSKGDILAVSFNSRFVDVEAPVRGQSAR